VPGAKGKTKLVTAADYWLGHQDRRQHLGGVVCDPTGRTGPDFLNVWQGFAVEPKPGKCDIIMEHLHEVVCAGDDRIYDYGLGWLATKVQRPGNPPETAFVMRGPKGVGKGFLGHLMRNVFGVHGMHVSRVEHLTSKFNTHMLNCCLLFADEAFFAGDRRHEKILNGLITEPVLTIEKKGVDAFQARNRLGIIIATNADWAVPATADERRYFVTDVSAARRGDRAYFTQLFQAGSNPDAVAAFVHELLEVDLSGFEIRDVPETEGLNDQKLASLDDFETWLLECLTLGYLPDSDPKLQPPWTEWWATTPTYEAFKVWSQRKGTLRFARNIAQFGKFMTRFYGTPVRPRGSATRQRAYALGTLEEARARFCEVQKVTVGWPD
jgi:hypothetical protein